MKKRQWNQEEKLKILKEAEENGVEITLRKNAIFPATYYSWRKKYEESGVAGLKHGMNSGKIKRIKELEKENALLKKLLAEKDLQIELKDQLLKKNYPGRR